APHSQKSPSADAPPKPSAKRLAVIGAGPKGLAIGAKARALAAVGLGSVDVTIIEDYSIAAHWLGRHGFTDGNQTLGTPPDKDVAFPHRSAYGPEVVRCMLGYSWTHYRAVHKRDFGEWVDAGR